MTQRTAKLGLKLQEKFVNESQSINPHDEFISLSFVELKIRSSGLDEGLVFASCRSREVYALFEPLSMHCFSYCTDFNISSFDLCD